MHSHMLKMGLDHPFPAPVHEKIPYTLSTDKWYHAWMGWVGDRLGRGKSSAYFTRHTECVWVHLPLECKTRQTALISFSDAVSKLICSQKEKPEGHPDLQSWETIQEWRQFCYSLNKYTLNIFYVTGTTLEVKYVLCIYLKPIVSHFVSEHLA